MSRRNRQLAALAGCVAAAAGLATLVESGTEPTEPPRVGDTEIWIEPGAGAGVDRPDPPSGDGEIARLSSRGPGSGRAATRAEGIAAPDYLRRERPRVQAVGHRFLEAYFAYESGDRTVAVRRVRALASEALAERLLAGVARLPAALERRPARARITALAVEFDKPPDTAACRAEVERDGDRSGIGLVLELERGSWTVVEVTE